MKLIKLRSSVNGHDIYIRQDLVTTVMPAKDLKSTLIGLNLHIANNTIGVENTMEEVIKQLTEGEQ